MNRREWKNLGLAAAMLLLLTKYQNCAPVNSPAASDPTLRIVDDLGEQKVVFASPQMTARHTATDLFVYGLCPRTDKESLTWTLSDNQAIVSQGQAGCEMGGFQINISQLQEWTCDHDYQLSAVSESGDINQMSVRRLCAPSTSKVLPDLGEVSTDVCYLETRTDSNSEASCAQICYRNQVVVLDRPLNMNLCASGS